MGQRQNHTRENEMKTRSKTRKNTQATRISYLIKTDKKSSHGKQNKRQNLVDQNSNQTSNHKLFFVFLHFKVPDLSSLG